MATEKFKTLQTLLETATHRVEEKQKEIAAVNGRIRATEEEISTLNKRMEEEADAAAHSGDAHLISMAGQFAERARKMIKNLGQKLVELEKKLRVLQTELREAHAEQKRYDILLERRLAEHKRKVAQLQQDEMDEMAGGRHQKRQP